MHFYSCAVSSAVHLSGGITYQHDILPDQFTVDPNPSIP
jgi:hypothetical protein